MRMPAGERRASIGTSAFILAALLSLVVVAGLGGCAGGDEEEVGGASTVVTTTSGKIKSISAASGVEAFLGIPYAAPPVGELRWRAPQPAQPWPGIRDGGRPGSPCLQGSPHDGDLGEASSEDCLYLNVFRPDLDAERGDGGRDGDGDGGRGNGGRGGLPVMVWIHGGGFVGGSALDVDAAGLVAGGREAGSPVLVVSANYRLGALGYLALPGLNAESGGDSGTYATQDLTAALRWVRDNVAAFGGDPGNVMIFGESAGAMNVCALLASPPAFGLFHRAAAQSGPCTWPFPPMADAEQAGITLAQKLDCPDPASAAACLRSQPGRAVLAAAGGQENILSYHPWVPVVGGPTLPQRIPQALERGAWANVPVITGTVRDEGRGFTGAWVATGPIDENRYVNIIRWYFPDRTDTVLAAYPPGSAQPRELLAKVITDSVFACPADATASLLAATGAPVYAYELDVPDQPPITDGVDPGATHGWDLRFLFPPTDPHAETELTTDARRALSRQVIGYWTRFAATGDPNAPAGGAPDWPRWPDMPENAESRKLLLTPEAVRAVGGAAAAHRCDVWG